MMNYVELITTYVLVSATITVPNRKNVIIKNYAPFTNCIIQINSSQIDNAKDINIVMPMYSFTEYSDK